MSDNKAKQIYVDIDAIFDLRMGTLAYLSQEFAFEISSQPEYYYRDTEEFKSATMGTLTVAQYKEVRKKFADKILGMSVVTHVPEFVKHYCFDVHERQASMPIDGKIGIVINTYPFTFTDEEATEFLQSALTAFGGFFDIELVTWKYEDMTPDFMGARFYSGIFYNPTDWINAQADKLQKGTLASFVLYTPRINHEGQFDELMLKDFQEQSGGTDVYKFLENYLKPAFTLKFIDLCTFCIATPINNKKFLFDYIKSKGSEK